MPKFTRITVKIRRSISSLHRDCPPIIFPVNIPPRTFPVNIRQTIAPRKLVFEDEESGERGVHVPVKIGGAVQQHQPDLVVLVETEDDDVRRGRPVWNALRPDGRHHSAILHDHHRRLSTFTIDTFIRIRRRHR